MTQNQIPNPYTNNPAAPGTTPNVTPRPVTGASPSALGVKPDARLAQAFLTQAFVWMFAGLLVTAGVAYVVQTQRDAAGTSPQGSFFLLFIAQLAIVVVISGRDPADQRHRWRWACSSSTPRRSGSRSA